MLVGGYGLSVHVCWCVLGLGVYMCAYVCVHLSVYVHSAGVCVN